MSLLTMIIRSNKTDITNTAYQNRVMAYKYKTRGLNMSQLVQFNYNWWMALLSTGHQTRTMALKMKINKRQKTWDNRSYEFIY